MSSAVYNRLHGIFKSRSTTTNSAAATTNSAATTTIIKANAVNPTSSATPSAAVDAAPTITVEKPVFEPLPISHLTKTLGNLKVFIDRFKRASDKGSFRYNHSYYEDVVIQLSRAKQHAFIEEILEHQKRYPIDITNEAFMVRLIRLYGKAQMYDHARKLFDEMPNLSCPRTVLSANALLMACINSKTFSEIPELFRELRDELSIEPDDVSYNVVIKALCKLGGTDSALLVMNEMEKNGCKTSLYTFNTVLDALYEIGNMSEAEKMWEKMESKNLVPDVISYNSKLRGLVVDKRVSEAVGLIEEMESKGVYPDAYTYNGLIHGFVKEDNLTEVKRWYQQMLKKEIVPNPVTYRIIIPFASKKGDFHFGFELSKDALTRELNIGRQNLKGVLRGLVKESKIDEAKELVELVEKSPHVYYKFALPAKYLEH